MAMQHFKNKIDIDAIVTKVSPYAVYLGLFNNKIRAKLPVKKGAVPVQKEGEIIKVMISYLSNTRIVVEPITGN
jgi:hypothetical protein